MRKSIVVLIVAVLAVAAGAVVLSPVGSRVGRGGGVPAHLALLPGTGDLVPGGRGRGAGSAGGRLPRSDFQGGLPAHSFRDMVEVNVVGGEEALHVVLSMEDGLFAVYQDPDWSYAIREGEALAAAVESAAARMRGP